MYGLILHEKVRKRGVNYLCKKGPTGPKQLKNAFKQEIVRNSTQGICELSLTVSPLIIRRKIIIQIIHYTSHVDFCACTRVRGTYFFSERHVCVPIERIAIGIVNNFTKTNGSFPAIQDMTARERVALLDTVCFMRRRNQKPHFRRN